MKASVVIPTFQGRRSLPAVLEGLARQTEPGFEVLLVSDGPKPAWMARLRAPFPMRIFAQAHAGAGAARNLGAREARAPVLIFLADDVVPDAFFVESHLRAHPGKQPRAAVGITAWHPALSLTPLMRRIAPAGDLTPYHLIRDPGNLDYDFLYGSNLSLPRSLALRFPFDPAFSGYGWEDTDLGYRLRKAGVRLVLAPKAVGWHVHRYTARDWAWRRRQARTAFTRFLGLHPEEGVRLVAAHKAALANRERQVAATLKQAEAVLEESRERKAEAERLLEARRLAERSRGRERLVLRTDAENLRMDSRQRLAEVRRLTLQVRRLESELSETNRNAQREIEIARQSASTLRHESDLSKQDAANLREEVRRLKDLEEAVRDLPWKLEALHWSGAHAEKGWHSWENTDTREPFRWSAPRAALQLPPSRSRGKWEMDIGITPACGVKNLLLRIGASVRRVPLKSGRTRIALGELPPGASVHLKASPPGKAPKDPRPLGIQLFALRRIQ